MRQELISFLDDHNLLQEGTSGTLRWQYSDLGKCLAAKYPKLLWDPPREGGERRVEVWVRTGPSFGRDCSGSFRSPFGATRHSRNAPLRFTLRPTTADVTSR
ncbi:unnamed protein product [Ixodes pacificus]